MDTATIDARAMKVIAEPTRLQLLSCIGPNGITGDRLAARFPHLPPDMFVWHLGRLRGYGLVERTRTRGGDRRSYHYRIVPEAFVKLTGRLTSPAAHYQP